MTASPSLTALIRRVASALDSAGFVYAVVGAFGRNAWARPRATTDADFAVAVPPGRVEQLREVIAALGLVIRRGQGEVGEVPPLFLLVDAADPSLRVDLLVALTPFEDDVLLRRVPASIAGADLWVATAEDMIVYKLVAGRPRDYADAYEIARTRAIAGAPLDWGHVERWTREFGLSGRVDDLRAQLARG